MAEHNLNYCMGILAVIFGYMIGSAVGMETNDKKLNRNRMEFFETNQRKTNIYGTVLYAFLMLNLLVMLSSWPSWMKELFVIYSFCDFVIIGTKPYGTNGTTAEIQPDRLVQILSARNKLT